MLKAKALHTYVCGAFFITTYVRGGDWMKTLIQNADWIITMDEQRRKIKHGDLVFEGKEIIEIGNSLDKKYRDCKVINAAGKIVIPGFVNVHHHTWQSLVRNINVANGLKLEPWLKVVYEIFKEINTDVARAGAYAGLGELLKTGCTTSNDLFYAHPVGVEKLIDAEIEAAAEMGIRFHPNRGVHSKASDIVPPELVGKTETVIADAERLIHKYHSKERFSMCRVGIAPNMPQYETLEILEESKKLAEKYDVMVHGHLAESVFETKYTLDTFGCTPARWFEKHGLLGKRFYYAHCVHLDTEEVKLMAETDTGVAHCPISNMFLNSGVCRIPDLMRANVRVGLGVDGAASSNSSNMLQEIRCAYLLNRLTWGDQAVSAEDILYLATVGGAKVLGRDDIGYLAPGMAADITIMDWDQMQYAGGKNDPVDCIVLSGESKLVDIVIVNGEIVVSNGKLTKIDENKKKEFVNDVGKAMLRRAATHLDGLEQDVED